MTTIVFTLSRCVAVETVAVRPDRMSPHETSTTAEVRIAISRGVFQARVEICMREKIRGQAAIRNMLRPGTLSPTRVRDGIVAGLLSCVLFACERAERKPVPPPARPTAATLTALGRTLFFDNALSASGRTACSSCHDPNHDYG